MDVSHKMGFSQSRNITWFHAKGGPDLMKGESAKLLIMKDGVVVQGNCIGGIGFNSEDISYVEIVYVSGSKMVIKDEKKIKGPHTNPYHMLAVIPSIEVIPVKTYVSTDTTINLYFDREAYKPLEAKTITLINAGKKILAVFNINDSEMRF